MKLTLTQYESALLEQDNARAKEEHEQDASDVDGARLAEKAKRADSPLTSRLT